jgi:acyl-CoA thioester hydrolase
MTGQPGYRFTHQETVRWSDADLMGVLNNAVYLTLLEQARYAYFRRLGLMRGESGFPFVLGSTSVRFLAPGRAGMQLAIGARVTRLGGRSFDMDFAVRSGDLLLATATATLVCVGEDLRSQPIPDAFRAAVARFEGLDACGPPAT